jgi:polysaccharide export outer membrane protein
MPALFLLASCSSGAPPHPATPPPAGPERGPVELPPNMPRPALTLVPGDLVRITVFQQADLDLELRIPDGGVIRFPLIGDVRAAGTTTSGLEDVIRQRLAAEYLQSPSVTITVKEYVKRRVFIVGGVAKPDGYELAPAARMTVLQLVAAAGGLTEKAVRESVQVIRRQGAGERILLRLPLGEVESRLALGKGDADLELWPDDLVVVPTSTRVAYVLGQVTRPGPVELPSDRRFTASMAVSAAGSYTRFASGSIQVLRRGADGVSRSFVVDLDAALGGQAEADAEVLPGDVIWVPERSLF